LFISERTIVSHVRNIMNKPGFSSRADRQMDDGAGSLAIFSAELAHAGQHPDFARIGELVVGRIGPPFG